ncbi:RES domain-containing protein [Caballeronia arationis]|uniref:RES domain-containing protein n=2 Tax=Caballeronia arationis TaxID=1777142 RepID=A0A7Z7I3Y0_9BURK|nr:RES domain-containing protein [Caballeronia arationis]SOE56754.1 RES domain-containing protein [Caballeronia arationis]
MPVGNEAVLHRVSFSEAKPGVYWHVYSRRYSPTSSNPLSRARLAWCDGSHAMFYTGKTPAAALWETVLRYAAVDDGCVYAHPAHLQNMTLARLTLTVSARAIDLRAPYRRQVVDAGSDLDAVWEKVLREPDHEKTHDFTAGIMKHLADKGHPDGPALMWHSRQAGAETATLFFEPPMQSSWWRHEPHDLYPLDEPEGEHQILLALAAQGLRWRGSPSGNEFDPPVGVN